MRFELQCALILVLALGAAFLPACGGGGGDLNAPPAVNLAGDDDEDGLTGQVEVEGWEILIDSYGFGQSDRRDLVLERRHVTCDPSKADTDGDGLDDLTEWIIRTDPRDPDTDKDELTDFEEWNWYFTSPVSADSDGDATGSGDESPNGFLFDGQEVLVGTVKGRTSPTHADTDGDGLTDGQEIDHATRSPIIADFPKIKLEILGEPVIALRIEYSDGTVLEEGISEEETNSTEVSRVSTSSRTQESHIGGSFQVMAGYEYKLGIKSGVDTEVSKEVTQKVEVTAGVDWGSSDSTTTEYSEGFTRGASRTTARIASESNERTETAASGEIMIRVRIRNVSEAIAFEVTQVGVAARLWTTPTDPREAPSFRQLAILTLPPGMAGGVTLSPGAATAELTFQAENVNAAVIKEFLRNPSALTFEPVYFDLSDGEGLNFAFLTENTYTQTAMIEIDDGTAEPLVVRVATNIDRVEPDADGNGGGAFRGITMGEALEEVLGLKRGVDWDVTERDVEIQGVIRKVNALYRLQGKTEGGGPPAPRFVGQAQVTAGSREVVLLDGPTPNDEDTPARFVTGWEADWIGRTLSLKDDDQAYVPVALKDTDVPGSDPLQATLILDRPYGGASRTDQYTLDDLFQADACTTPIVADTELVDVGGSLRGFWMVLATDGEQLQPTINFEDIVLRAGDQVRLSFWEDADGDGTSGRTEQYFGTANACLDCDEDGLGDSVEIIRGWIAGAPDVLPIERERFFLVVDALRTGASFPLVIDGDLDIQEEEFNRLARKLRLDDPARNYPRWVRSSPTAADADLDALSDLMECMAGTDPNHPDTDGDGLPDGSDPSPLKPAAILHVDPEFLDGPDTPSVTSAERGLAWDAAFEHLQDALAAAAHRNNDFLPDPDPDTGELVLDVANDVSFIFVKEGEYAPNEYAAGGPYDQPAIASSLFKSLGTFVLLPDVVIFGGFAGGEQRLADRPLSPPVTTTLTPNVAMGLPIVTCGGAAARARVEAGAGLRDLTIGGGSAAQGAGLMNLGGAPTLLNVTFRSNTASSQGGAIYERDGASKSESGAVSTNPAAEYTQCAFDDNVASAVGGGAVAALNSSSRFAECTFTNNRASGFGAQGGAIYSSAALQQVLSMHACEFRQNEAHAGGAIAVGSGNALVKDCYFWKNSTNPLDPRDAAWTTFGHSQWVTGLTATSKYEFDVFYGYDGTYYEDSGAEDAVKVLTFADGEPLVGKQLDGVTTYPDYERATPTYYDDFVTRMLLFGVRVGTGGAIRALGGHVATVQCVFDRNEALAGGALAFFGAAKFDVYNCTFAHNAALGLAGAVYAPNGTSRGTMRNTLAVGGEPDRPILDQPDDSTAQLAGSYNLFRYADEVGVGNVDENKSAAEYTDLKNFVKQDPVIPPEFYVQGTGYRFLNCLVQTGVDGSGALDSSGIDVESDLGVNQLNRAGVRVLDLGSTSAAIDAGVDTFDFDPFTPGAQGLPFDVAGTPREKDRIDIGAYEFEL